MKKEIAGLQSPVITREDYDKLRKTVDYHFRKYYEDDSPEVSDEAYDAMMRRLRMAEELHPEWVQPDSPSQKAGGKTKAEAGQDVTHNIPMLSIEDVFGKEEVAAWIRKVKSVYPDAEFCVEHKIDGLSLTLVYEDGHFMRAETRGDGYVGEDVTEKAIEISDMKREIGVKIPYLEVRAEVYISYNNFSIYNQKMETEGKKPAANPRNLASGTLRQNDPGAVRERSLSMFLFNVQDSSDTEYTEEHHSGIMRLGAEGVMPVVPSVVCGSEEEVLDAIYTVEKERSSLPYPIDGAVVKINQKRYQSDFKGASKYTPGHIAYKYPAEVAETELLDIEVSVGRTGRLTPTACFAPVWLCGTTVSRATLNNQDFIDALDLGIGDTIRIYKAGEIIPAVASVNKEKRKEGWQPYRMPELCPVCKERIRRRKNADGSDGQHYCMNPLCESRRVRSLAHFGSRDAMNIDGISEKTVEKLAEEGMIRDFTDFYTLKDNPKFLQMKDKSGWGEQSVKNLLAAIEKSRNTSLKRLLYAFSIPNVGRDQSRIIAEECGYDWETFLYAMESGKDFTYAEGIGPVIQESLKDWFCTALSSELGAKIRDMASGFVFDKPEDLPGSGGIAGMNFAVTGGMEHFQNREELKAFIQERGGKVSGSVSKNTDYLINNNPSSTSGKSKKAAVLGIPVITEEEFLGLAGQKLHVQKIA